MLKDGLRGAPVSSRGKENRISRTRLHFRTLVVPSTRFGLIPGDRFEQKLKTTAGKYSTCDYTESEWRCRDRESKKGPYAGSEGTPAPSSRHDESESVLLRSHWGIGAKNMPSARAQIVQLHTGFTSFVLKQTDSPLSRKRALESVSDAIQVFRSPPWN